jgi:hypothetical protein
MSVRYCTVVIVRDAKKKKSNCDRVVHPKDLRRVTFQTAVEEKHCLSRACIGRSCRMRERDAIFSYGVTRTEWSERLQPYVVDEDDDAAAAAAGTAAATCRVIGVSRSAGVENNLQQFALSPWTCHTTSVVPRDAGVCVTEDLATLPDHTARS